MMRRITVVVIALSFVGAVLRILLEAEARGVHPFVLGFFILLVGVILFFSAREALKLRKKGIEWKGKI